MKNDLKLLDIMMQDQLEQKDLYRPGPYWQEASSRTSKAIHSDGLQNFRANSRIGKGFADTILMNPFDLSSLDSLKSKVFNNLIKLPVFKRNFIDLFIKQNEWHSQQTQKFKGLYYETILGNWFSQFSKKYDPLPDTLIENPQNTISINGYRMGKSYLDAFLRIHNLSRVVDFSKVTSVFEIGGGFGAFAHTLLHLYPNIKKFIYLDMPPVLYVGTQYLKHFYGDEVMDYQQTRELDRINFSDNNEREIIAICPWEIEKIDTSIDFFFNSSSFQEMKEEMIINYSQHVNRMLKDDESRFCLFMYKGGRPESTLMPKEVTEIVEKDTLVVFEELEPEFEIEENSYYIGLKK